jgi:hypothetical protein
MIVPNPVLSPMDKANNSACGVSADAYTKRMLGIGSKQDVDKAALTLIRNQLTQLSTDCSPQFRQQLEHYLEGPSATDEALLDAWAKCGRNDRSRCVNLRLTEVARNTISPLGMACLIRYARAWLDEAEARASQLEAVATPPAKPKAKLKKGKRKK